MNSLKTSQSNLSPPSTPRSQDKAILEPRYGLSLRAVLLGLLLNVPCTFWTTVIEVRWYALDGTCLPLFIMPIFFLFWLVILNRGVRSLSSRWALSQQELLIVYIVLVVGTVMSAHDMLQNLFGSIGHAAYFATPENHWKSLFFPLLPKFWIVTDPTALKHFYRGNANPYDPHNWGPFVVPLLWWLLFIGTLIGICLCLNILIRTRWSAHERLAFPIVQLPVALTEPAQSAFANLLSNRVMWAGFLCAAILDLINGMHNLYPSWPYIPYLKLYNLGQFFTTRPWSAIRDTNISMYPFAIGLAYFVPLDLSFSCWFFFVARKLFQVLGATMGWDGPGSGGFPYFPQQASGAWIAWGLTIVWALRGQFRHAWGVAFRGEATNQHEEPGLKRHYQAAFLGLATGVLILFFYGWRLHLSAWVGFLFFALYFLLAITITRARAELGTPHEIYFVNPRLILVTLFGSQAIGAQSLTDLSTMYWFNRGYRCHPMPNQLEAMRMGEMARIRQSSIIAILLIAFLWGALVTCWANIHVTFSNGATAKCIGYKVWVGQESYNALQQWLQTPARVDIRQIAYLVGGFLFVLFLRLMRGAFLWWPFHPAGYALAVSFAMDYFWCCFFIAWLAKSLLVRMGGMKTYQAAIPFFLGLILGDYVMGASWALFGAYNHLQAYKIFI